MFRTNFDKNLDGATSHLLLEPEWPSIMMCCDAINQKDIAPKNAFAAIKKKLNSTNPHTAYYACLVLESVVKNCGTPMHDEVFTKENCTMLSQFLEQTTHDNVRAKLLELIQTWAYAFRNSERYQAIKDTMTILKTKGHQFPELKEADAMFAMDTAPNWTDGKKCHRCRDDFTFTNRKHHCRNCGQVFCGQCTSKSCPLPKFGIEKDVRVCDGCYAQLQRPTSAKATGRPGETDLPAEYLNSSLAQQVQTPPRKTEQELKEEEELQLALALSQSEAESKKQQQQQQQQTIAAYRLQQRSPSPEAPPAPKEPQPEETNPDLAKYLNRSYWEQRKVSDSPMASPSAPSPMPATPQPQGMMGPQQQQTQSQQQPLTANDFRPKSTDEQKIDEFAANMRAQVEIFVNRMKSNSSRGRSIANDSSVQTLFMTLTNLHSQQLSFIKELDDKRMWYEQLQDKLAQIKDSRAALDDLRNEHAENLRRMAEEQERQRQIQMAQKLEIMRKKKQEYLQYQRQLALHRIQEQEREMQLRQEQQMAQYRMNQTAFPFMPAMAGMPPQGSPSQQPQHLAGIQPPGVYNPYSPSATTTAGAAMVGGMPPYHTTQAAAAAMTGMQYPSMPPQGLPQAGNMMMQQQQPGPLNQPHVMQNHMPQAGGMMPQPQQQQQSQPHQPQPGPPMAAGGEPQSQQQQQQQPMPTHNHHVPQVNNQIPVTNNQAMPQGPGPQLSAMRGAPVPHPPHMAHVMLQQQQHLMHGQSPIPNIGNLPGPQANPMTTISSPQIQQQQQQQQVAASLPPQTPQQVPAPQPQPQMQPPPPQMQAATQIQAVQSAPAPPQHEPEPAAPPAHEEPATAELISFD
ncbi:hepatocyte growth factor-regulated tyrosine kinase substrate [Musca vetustissima]|uniref:hepatocyte growth factor-regulated tyrosine kinase substrate n=1 Tax=Musca vetustissima TaxID=27455 RepID=UPI002AB65EBF|nr:hepatocyte growth factor-regulated tyrosine kinase substrate [Musca vetustissima]